MKMKLRDGPLDNGDDSIPMKPNNTKTTTNNEKETRKDRIECRQQQDCSGTCDHHRRHRPLHSTFLRMVTVVTVPVLTFVCTGVVCNAASFVSSSPRSRINLERILQPRNNGLLLFHGNKIVRSDNRPSHHPFRNHKNRSRSGLHAVRKADIPSETDVIVVGGGLGGLCAAAILRRIYNKSVLVLESHDTVGGCAHSYTRRSKPTSLSSRRFLFGKKGKRNGSADGSADGSGTNKGIEFLFDSGPTIVLGCSTYPRNPLQQVLEAVGDGGKSGVEWLPYDGWGMVVNQNTDGSTITKPQWSYWKFPVGLPPTSPTSFQNTALADQAGPSALSEFEQLLKITQPLVSMGSSIPAMAMRASEPTEQLLPLLRYPTALFDVIRSGDKATGPFGPYMDGPEFVVKDRWLRAWLDALAFSLSGLEARRTPAAAMAYVLYDLHREGSCLDYPKGGMGKVSEVLVEAIERGGVGGGTDGGEEEAAMGRVVVNSHVERIDTEDGGRRVVGVTLRKGKKKIKAKIGVICNAPIWSLRKLLDKDGMKVLDQATPPDTWNRKQKAKATAPLETGTEEENEEGYLTALDKTEMTRSFLHLHLALKSEGLDLEAMEAHYTVMAKGLYAGDDAKQQPDVCGDLNMIAVSNPCILDRTLAPPGHIVVHAYAAGNEPYSLWSKEPRSEYEDLKEKRAAVLWSAVESVIPDVRSRVVLAEVGSPLTHERFLRRPRGTYGATTEDLLPDGKTTVDGLVVCGDSVFPGIGVPAVAVSGAGAANSMVGVWEQWRAMDRLKDEGVMV